MVGSRGVSGGDKETFLLVSEQQEDLPNASVETEPCAAAAADLQQLLREFRAE